MSESWPDLPDDPPPDLTPEQRRDEFAAILAEGVLRFLRQEAAHATAEATRAHSKPHMIRKIAWRIQALAEGELSERARQRAAELCG